MCAQFTSAFVLTALALSAVPLWGQTQLRVPSGGAVTARLEGVTAKIAVAAAPRVVTLEFGRREQGRFVPYAAGQPIAFDVPFLIRVGYDVAPPETRKEVFVTWGDRESRRVIVTRTATPTVFESRDLLLDDPRACTGFDFCADPEELSYAP